MLGRDVVTPDGGEPRRVLPHPLQRGPGVNQVLSFGGEYGLGIFRHAGTSA